jgi:hypothetical protein
MNHSIYGADRLTHLKIVVVALVGAILVAGVGIAARGTTDENSVVALRGQGHGPVIRAGAPVVVVGGREDSTIR